MVALRSSIIYVSNTYTKQEQARRWDTKQEQ